MLKRLPDAEFEVMKIVWNNDPPITTLQIMGQLGSKKEWKPQTVLTMLARLIKKGFLQSERVGRERNYTPAICEQEYMHIETEDFMNRYRGNSLGSLVKALYDDHSLSEEDLRALKDWFAERT